ncbi:MAG: hypothetical protein V4608_15185 [Bacteroidota bacterium]
MITSIIYPVLLFGTVAFFIYLIKKQYFKSVENFEHLEIEKKYLLRTVGQFKIDDSKIVSDSYTEVIVYIYEKYLIATTPGTSNNQPLKNILFYKTEPQLDQINTFAKAQINTTEFSDNSLAISANIKEHSSNSSNEQTDCYLLFAHIDEQTKLIIENF